MKILQFLQKNLVFTIPAFMVLGLIYGANIDAVRLKTTILPLTFLMVYPMMVNLNIKKVFSKGDNKVQVTTQLVNFILIPFIGYILGRLFFPENPILMLGLLLTSLLPTSGMTISWTGFAKGNMVEAVKMTVIGLILGSAITPLYLQLLLGAKIEIPLAKVFQQIIVVVFLPMLFGYITQQFIIKKYGMAKYQKDIKKIFPPISTLGVLSIVFVAMALKAKSIVADPTVLIKYAIPLAILYIANFAISTLIGKYFFTRANGIALVYGSVLRNLSIALAIAMTVFGSEGSEIALIIAVAYIIQTQSAAWYVKFTNVIFGQAPPDVAGDVMSKGVFTINDDKSIKEAIELFEEEHIHSLVVMDSTNKPIGILNTRNLFDHIINNSTDISQKISDIDLKPILIFNETDPLILIGKEMKDNNVYKVLVKDAKQQLCGVITETTYFKRIVKSK
nr:bile acid:sodium symporter [uncultured Carboxylicivirga sp.]